jgi:LmbE family N-acetylglucosaminyl deacetylase
MLSLNFNGLITNILCLGAHCDDIEIGCGGTILRLAEANSKLIFHWVIFSSDQVRAKEAVESAHVFLENVPTKNIIIKDYKDGFFPFCGAEIKEYFEQLKQEVSPDLVFTHFRKDLHQDHRIISDLTWNTFRNNLILEYEIPKYDGDLGHPNCFFHLDESTCSRKIQIIMSVFKTQKNKHWFTEDTFLSLLRIRGIESQAPTKYAEAFYCRKMVF